MAAPLTASILVPRNSPIAVYARNRQFIENALSRVSAAQATVFEKQKVMQQSRTYRLLLETKGTRGDDALRWKKLFDNFMEPPTDGGNPPEVAELHRSDYASVHAGDLESLGAFLGDTKNWKTGRDAESVTLPGDDSDVARALALHIEDDTTIQMRNFTIGRLYRCFQGSFLVSAKYRNEKQGILVRADSAFMENVFRPWRTQTGEMNRPIPIIDAYIWRPDHVISPLLPLADDAGVYFNMPLVNTLQSLKQAIAEIASVIETSGDDVI